MVHSPAEISWSRLLLIDMWLSKVLCHSSTRSTPHEAAPKISESAVKHLDSGNSPITPRA
ncbi:hypothetical protein Mapa_007095 [Marchantia paleacea]|nr:hypothetical protein Mapa_007095 [Marchantia paleacea]